MQKYPSKIKSIKGKNIAITGKCWLKRNDLIKIIEKSGGSVLDNHGAVTDSTNVLIRGVSSQWAYKKYGLKESRVSDQLKEGRLIVLVEDYEIKKLLETGNPAKTLNRIAGQPIEWLLPPISENKYKKISIIEGDLDRELSTNGRIEQKFLREKLFGDKEISQCGICRRKLPVQLLIAGHIKPRSKCSIKEKRDFNNIVFPVCVLGCDALYEKGFIGVNNTGKIVITKSLKLSKDLRMTLNKLKNKKCLAWNSETKKYFTWHFERRFEH